MALTYYITDDSGSVRGPLTISQLQGLWAHGEITVETQICLNGEETWHRAEEFLDVLEPKKSDPELFEEMGVGRTRAVPAYSNPRISQKSRGIYIILGLFFGMLGIHNFYAGRYRWGVYQIIATTVVIAIFSPFLLSYDSEYFIALLPFATIACWVVVELFVIDRDGNGEPMT